MEKEEVVANEELEEIEGKSCICAILSNSNHDKYKPNSYFEVTLRDLSEIKLIKLIASVQGLPTKINLCKPQTKNSRSLPYHASILSTVERIRVGQDNSLILSIKTHNPVKIENKSQSDEKVFSIYEDLPVPDNMHNQLLELIEKVKTEYIDWYAKKYNSSPERVAEYKAFLYFDEKSMSLDKYASDFSFDILELIRGDSADDGASLLPTVFATQNILERLEIFISFFSGNLKLDKQKGNKGF